MSQKLEMYENPVLRNREAVLDEELHRRFAALQRLTREKNLGALLLPRGQKGNDRWVNNIYTFGERNPGWYVIPRVGFALATRTDTLEPSGHSRGHGPLALYDADDRLVAWLTDMDLMDMLGDQIDRDGVELDEVFTPPRSGNAKLVWGLGWEDVRQLLGGTLRIGADDPDSLSASVTHYLNEHLPGLEWVDIGSELDALKAAKSDTERQVLDDIARQHDRIAAAIAPLLTPGRTERDLMADVKYTAYHFGAAGFDWADCVQVLLESFSMEGEAPSAPFPYPGKRLEEGDCVCLRVRSIGTSGFHGSIGRCWCLGKPTPAIQALWDTAVAAQEHCLGLLKPGATLEDARRGVNAWLDAHDLPSAPECFLHGLGLSHVEAPRLNHRSQSMPLAEGTVLSVRVPVRHARYGVFACEDMVEITADGARRMTRFPRELTVL